MTIHDETTFELLDSDEIDLDEFDSIYVDALGGGDTVLNHTNIRAEIYGRGGNDYIKGGTGNDLIDGGADSDSLIGRAGNDDLYGGTGDDNFVFEAFQFVDQPGLLGSDVIYEDANQDVDQLDFNRFIGPVNVDLSLTTAQVVNAGHLTLRLISSTGIENVYGSEYEDVIRGNSRQNELMGSYGTDYLYGRGGADFLIGYEGNDWLYGEAGNDNLAGGTEHDVLYGGTENDDLFGGDGNDEL